MYSKIRPLGLYLYFRYLDHHSFHAKIIYFEWLKIISFDYLKFAKIKLSLNKHDKRMIETLKENVTLLWTFSINFLILVRHLICAEDKD